MININDSFSTRKALTNIEVLILLIISFFSLLAGLVILVDSTKPNYYEMLPLLPFSFCLINLISFKVYHNINTKITNIIILFVYIIRNVVTPLLMTLGEYRSFFTILNFQNVNFAILLMIYETFIVFMYLSWGSEKKINTNIRDKAYKLNFSRKKFVFFGISIFIILIYCIYAYVKVPEIRASYVSIFDSNKLITLLSAPDQFSTGSINRILFTLFNFFFGILQIFLPIYFIYNLRDKLGDRYFVALLACGIACINFFFMTNETAYTLIVVLVLFIVIIKLFTKHRNKILLTAGGGFAFLLINLFILKTSDMRMVSDSGLSNTSIMLQAYFPGVSNVAGVYNIVNHSKFTTLFYDLYSMVPFRATLFGIPGDKRLVLLYTQQNLAPANILPFIGQSYHYLGFIFAPLPSVFFIKIAKKYQQKLSGEKNIWKYSTYLLFEIFICSSLVLYNPTIFGARFFITILPMMILANHSSNKYSFK